MGIHNSGEIHHSRSKITPLYKGTVSLIGRQTIWMTPAFREFDERRGLRQLTLRYRRITSRGLVPDVVLFPIRIFLKRWEPKKLLL